MANLLNFIFAIPTALAQTTVADKTASSTTNIFGFILQGLPLWITAIVVLIFSMVLGVILKNIVESRIASKITEEHQEFLIISGRLTFVTVTAIGVMIALTIAGINVTNLIAAIGFGISFGLQDTIANFVAGIALLASRPFTIGDWIEVNGKKGKVTQIRVRATYLDTYDGLRLIVPNSQLYKSQVLSYTSNPMRRMKVPAYTRYNIDMKEAFAICLNVVKSHANILLQPKPNIVVTEMGDYYIALEIRFWVDSRSMWRRIASNVFMEIQDKFVQAGIDSPYPTNALTFDTDDDQVFVKTKTLAPEEVNKILKMRERDEEEFTKRRQELVKPHLVSVDEMKNLDQSGATFLKVTTMPLSQTTGQMQPQIMQTELQQDQSAFPGQQPVFPPNSPQGMLQDIAAEQQQQQANFSGAVAPIPNEMPTNGPIQNGSTPQTQNPNQQT